VPFGRKKVTKVRGREMLEGKQRHFDFMKRATGAYEKEIKICFI